MSNRSRWYDWHATAAGLQPEDTVPWYERRFMVKKNMPRDSKIHVNVEGTVQYSSTLRRLNVYKFVIVVVVECIEQRGLGTGK